MMYNRFLKIKRYFSCLSVGTAVFLATLVVGCSADKNLELTGGESRLMITVSGVNGTDDNGIVSKAKATVKGIGTDMKNSMENTRAGNGASDGFTASITAQQSSISKMLDVSPANGGLRATATKASTQSMTVGYTYRILIYNKTTGKLWKTVQATAGTPLSIDAVKGDSYQWYAYSYNTSDNMPEPTDLANPAIETTIDRDLLYAKGEVSIPKTPTGQQDVVNIPITFNHKVAQVHVKIDATVLAQFATINNLKASFDQDSYLKKAVFSIKSEQMGQAQVVPTTTIFNVASANNVWEAKYYTVDAAAVTSYKVVLDDLPVQFKYADASMANRNLATYAGAANKPVFTYNFSSPAVGQSLYGLANLWYTLASRRILHISNNTTFGYSLEQGPSWDFLNAKENFGNLSNSLVKMAPYAAGQGVWIGGNASDDKSENWINYAPTANGDNAILAKLNPTDASKKPDIVILGYDVLYIRPNVATALLDYINNKGVVILLMQDNTGSENQNFFNTLFGVSDIQLSLQGSGGSMYPLVGNDPNDVILNGQVGDARGQLWGEDAGTTLGIVNPPLGQITVYSYGQPVNRGAVSFPNRVTMFKHNSKNFFFIGDGGFVSYNGGTSATICPFNYDQTTKRPLPKPFGDAGNGYSARSKSAYNSIVMGNIMLWAARTAEFNGIRPWKYAAAPTP